jgi:hypothetical protein
MGDDLLALVVAAMGAIGIILYASASELFDLKLLKLDPLQMRVPREIRIEYWYTRLAKRFYAFLFEGGWKYALGKKQAKVSIKRGYREFRKASKERLPEAVRKLNRDIALGTLVITVMLVAFLLIKFL